MTAVQWTPDLAVGVSLIDDQHKELFKRIDQLLEASSQGKGRDEIEKLIRFLSDYVVTHFGTEEKAMIQHGYGGITAHKGEHLAFVRDFGNLAKSYKTNGASTTLVLALQRRVIDWLNHHIRQSDKALGAFLKTKL